MMSPQIPTTVIHGPSGTRTRRPIGSSPGQYVFAMDSLTTATSAAPWRSASVKPRPRTIGIRIVEKYDAVATRLSTAGGFLGSANGWPSISNTRVELPPAAGAVLMAETCVTAGVAAIASIARSMNWRRAGSSAYVRPGSTIFIVSRPSGSYP
jgi:hypothetical protein